MLSTAGKHSCRRFFPPLPYASGMRCITPPTELVLCGLSTGIMSPLNVFVYLDEWLTVHPSITLVNFQLDAQNYLFIYNTFIKILYMFRAVRCSSSGGLIVSMQHLVASLSAVDCSVHRLRKKQFFLNP